MKPFIDPPKFGNHRQSKLHGPLKMTDSESLPEKIRRVLQELVKQAKDTKPAK